MLAITIVFATKVIANYLSFVRLSVSSLLVFDDGLQIFHIIVNCFNLLLVTSVFFDHTHDNPALLVYLLFCFFVFLGCVIFLLLDHHNYILNFFIQLTLNFLSKLLYRVTYRAERSFPLCWLIALIYRCHKHYELSSILILFFFRWGFNVLDVVTKNLDLLDSRMLLMLLHHSGKGISHNSYDHIQSRNWRKECGHYEDEVAHNFLLTCDITIKVHKRALGKQIFIKEYIEDPTVRILSDLMTFICRIQNEHGCTKHE